MVRSGRNRAVRRAAAALRGMVGVVLLALLTAACGGLPAAADQRPSVALTPAQARATALWQAADAGRGPAAGSNISGVRLLASGEEALASLLTLADRAQYTLDIQQYLIADDPSARAVLARVAAAAQRGVRVRVLVDDLNAAGQDPMYLGLRRHGDIEVRLFNPFPSGRFSLATRLLGGALDFGRLNHRMHNKLFIADNAVAITGGRNIGDEYFARHAESNFIDLDVVVAGPVVPRLSDSFDRFWNSRHARPVETLADADDAHAAPAHDVAPARRVEPAADFLRRELSEGRLRLQWVPVAALADEPAKLGSEEASDEEIIADDIAVMMRSARHELAVVSPYFVPGRKGVELMGELRRRGVRVRVVTNSLASTDAPLVHIGYARHRVDLLRLGVELYEVRPVLGQERSRFRPFRSSQASLHVKALVVDAKTLFVGSMNMDPRSAQTNSELGLLIRSASMARQVLAIVDDVAASGSYRLYLDHGNLRWATLDDGTPTSVDAEPQAGWWIRLALWLLSPLAPDELL